MNIKDLQERVEEIVMSAIKSGQSVEETIENETEKVAKDFFAKSGENAEKIQQTIADIVKDVKSKVDDSKALTGVAKGMLKGAQEGAKLSLQTAKDVAENVVKECLFVGIDLKEIPKLLFRNFKDTFFK